MSIIHDNLPNLKRLRAFEAAARLESFTAAAEELHVTQGAISRQVQALEQDLGLSLFTRAGRHLSLSEAGHSYAQSLGEAFQIIRTATRALHPEPESKVLTISMLPSFAVKWLAPRMGEFLAVHPDVDLRLSVSHDLSSFEDGVTAAIRYGQPPWPGCHHERLLEDLVFPVCHPSLLDGERILNRPEDIRQFPILHGNAPDDWQDWMRAVGAKDIPLPPGPQFDDGASLLQACIDGAGVALARSSLAALDLKAGRLVRPLPGELTSDHAFHLVWPKSAKMPTAFTSFKRWLRKECGPTP